MPRRKKTQDFLFARKKKWGALFLDVFSLSFHFDSLLRGLEEARSCSSPAPAASRFSPTTTGAAAGAEAAAEAAAAEAAAACFSFSATAAAAAAAAGAAGGSGGARAGGVGGGGGGEWRRRAAALPGRVVSVSVLFYSVLCTHVCM